MAAGWGGPLAGVVVLWVLVTLACAPLLAVSRIREPLSSWPTENLVRNFLVLTALIVIGHGALFLSRVVVTGSLGGSKLVQWTIGVAFGYPLVLWLLVGAAAMATGRWRPGTEAFGHWLWLGLAALWYAIVAAVAAAVVFLVLFVAYFPG